MGVFGFFVFFFLVFDELAEQTRRITAKQSIVSKLHATHEAMVI